MPQREPAAKTQEDPARTSSSNPSELRINDIDYLTRQEALELLGIKKESLYTYASRGLIRTVSEPGKRTRRYLKSDIEKLRTRAGIKSDGARVAPIFRYGEPVVQTWITEITDAGPRYRGLLATALASEGRSLEYTAELLWGGLPPLTDQPWPDARKHLAPSFLPAHRGMPLDPLHELTRIALHLAGASANDDDSPLDARSSGIRLIGTFAGVAGLLGPRGEYLPAAPQEFVAEQLLRGFGLEHRPDFPELVGILNAALVVSADNELTTPTFAARLIASTGADLYSCVVSALTAQAGPMQGGGAAHLESYLQSWLKTPKRPAAAASGIPCFDHPLYDKDPRAEMILQYIEQLERPRPERTPLLRFVRDTYEETGRYPNIFAAMVLLSLSLGLPNGSATFLHSLGRTAGWVSHAAEQRLSGTMLRPRARYMGSPP